MVAHIVWDWNGTLLDDVDLVVEAVNASLDHLGADPIDIETYQSNFERPLHRFYERLLGRRVDDALLGVIDDAFHDHYWKGYVGAELTAGAVEAIDRVATSGATQSVASMMRHEILVPSMRQFGIDARMLAVDGHRGRLGETKEQHMVRHVERLEKMYPDMDRRRMLAIGDIVDDAEAARAAGIACILYDGGGQSRDSLESTGMPVVGSLLEAVELALR